MRSFLIAAQFLTRVPIPLGAVTEREIGRSAIAFPIVGALAGGLLLGSYLLLGLVFPTPVARLLALVVLIVLSGAFHLDGLSDTVDGLYGGHDRESALRIMHDPHVGAMGVVAIVTILLVKAAALLSLSEEFVRGALLIMPIIGHGAMVVALALPAARPTGLGKVFAEHHSGRDLTVAVGVMTGATFGVLKVAGVCALAAALAASAVILGLAWQKIHGVTGDVCGAANEVAEGAFLLVLLAVSPVSFASLEQVLPGAFWRWHL